MVSVCREFRNSLAVSESLTRLQASCQSELLSPESWTGAGGFTSKVTCIHQRYTGAGFWQEASVPPHLGLSILQRAAWVSSQHGRWLSSKMSDLRESGGRREKRARERGECAPGGSYSFMPSPQMSCSIAPAAFYSLEASHLIWPMFKGSGIRLHLLKGGISKNLKTYF